jgi:hypothetical protein
MSGIRTLRSEHSILSSNHLKDLDDSRAITGMIICCGKRCTIIGNTVEGTHNSYCVGSYYLPLEYAHVIGNHAEGATHSGIWLCGSPSNHQWATTVANNTVADCGGDGIRLGNSYGGLGFADEIVGSRIVNNICWKNAGYGIGMVPGDGTITDTSIMGNDFTGNTSGATFGLSFDATCVVKDNLGYNPVGVGSISVDPSPFTYTAGSSPESIYVSGGTVTSITKNGTNLGIASGVFELQPYQSLEVTYSLAPTMIKDIH